MDGEFWGSENAEYARPGTPDGSSQTADVPLAELDLAIGAKIAYVFDYGDEWRVRLKLREEAEPDGGAYPRVLNRRRDAAPAVPRIRPRLSRASPRRGRRSGASRSRLFPSESPISCAVIGNCPFSRYL
ncbi:MAG: IS1096 element passenger TnpR family protein [Solirubrobacteraceae bacterium]